MAKAQVPKEMLDRIEEDLWPLVVPIDTLTPDPRTARIHTARNLKATSASLRDNKQQKAIVVNGDNLVLAGNGTLQAAVGLGWTHIARSRCTGSLKVQRKYKLVDNRSSDLAEDDYQILAEELAAIKADAPEQNWDDIGYSDGEVETFLMSEWETTGPADVPVPRDVGGKITLTKAQWKRFVEAVEVASKLADQSLSEAHALGKMVDSYLQGRDDPA
jgi:hypothetical protein